MEADAQSVLQSPLTTLDLPLEAIDSNIRLVGCDPVVPSRYRVGLASACALAAQAGARERQLPRKDLTDRRFGFSADTRAIAAAVLADSEMPSFWVIPPGTPGCIGARLAHIAGASRGPTKQ
jgi:hypothetical protein